jgi:DNA-binding NarL/FixJ family response regulator
VGRALEHSLRPLAPTHCARTCADAREALPTRRWYGAIFDIHLPDGSGLDLLEEMRATHDSLPALVMTGTYDPAVANRAHTLRASCVFKPEIATNVVLFAQRAIATRAEMHQRIIAAVGELASMHGLTPREAQVAELIALGVARERLGLELGVSENTLKTLVRRVLTKCSESRVEGVARAVLEAIVRLSCSADGP